MRPGEAPYRLSRTVAANDNRRRSNWRRLVSVTVLGAFTLTLILLGFNRYAHHPVYGGHHSDSLLIPN